MTQDKNVEMREEGRVRLQVVLASGDAKGALETKRAYSLGRADISSEGVQEALRKGVFSSFSRGDIESARRLYKKFLASSSDEARYEMLEIVRQAIHASLTKGSVDSAIKIRKAFKLPRELAEQIVKQAVLSCFYTDNFDRVLEIHSKIQIPKEIADEIVAYCISWKKTKYLTFARQIFSVPDSFAKFSDAA